MPLVAPSTPRKMLPPPMTSEVCAPLWAISFTSVAMRVSVLGSMPYLPSPMSASPDSLRRMRLYAMAPKLLDDGAPLVEARQQALRLRRVVVLVAGLDGRGDLH